MLRLQIIIVYIVIISTSNRHLSFSKLGRRSHCRVSTNRHVSGRLSFAVRQCTVYGAVFLKSLSRTVSALSDVSSSNESRATVFAFSLCSTTSSLENVRYFVCYLKSLLCGRKLFFWAALSEHGGACHFGPLSPLPWPLGHVRLISFLGLVCAALLFFSTC